MSDEITVHRDEFRPKGPGRPPLVDISKLIYAAADNQNQWVSMVLENSEATSAMNQLKARGYEVSSSMVDSDHREVYTRYAG